MDPRKIFGYILMEEAGDEGGAGAGGGAGGDEGGAGSEVSWRDGLEGDLKDSAALADFKDVGSLAKSFVDQQAYMGNSIRIPSEDASAEDRTAFVAKLQSKVPELMLKPNFENEEQSTEFYRTLGMPEKAEQYEVPTVEGFELPEERVQFLREIAHKHKVPNKQFQGFMADVLAADAAAVAEANQANATQTQESIAALKQEWGHAFDERVNQAKAIAEQTGAPQSLKDAIAKGQVSGDVYKWLHDINTRIGSENSDLTNNGDPKPSKLTPSEVKAQLNEIMGNKKHAYWDKHNPANADAIKRVVELQRLLQPAS